MTSTQMQEMQRAVKAEIDFHETMSAFCIYALGYSSTSTLEKSSGDSTVNIRNSAGRLPKVKRDTGEFEDVMGSRSFAEDHPEQYPRPQSG